MVFCPTMCWIGSSMDGIRQCSVYEGTARYKTAFRQKQILAETAGIRPDAVAGNVPKVNMDVGNSTTGPPLAPTKLQNLGPSPTDESRKDRGLGRAAQSGGPASPTAPQLHPLSTWMGSQTAAIPGDRAGLLCPSAKRSRGIRTRRRRGGSGPKMSFGDSEFSYS